LRRIFRLASASRGEETNTGSDLQLFHSPLEKIFGMTSACERLLERSLFLLVLPLARAAVINVEFKFTPFLGDPGKDEKVKSLPGKAAIFINGVPFAEQEVQENELPVLFDEHEVAPVVWLPMSSVGPVVRKGKNKLRIEFTPNDAAKPYRAQLRWASVTDRRHEKRNPAACVRPIRPMKASTIARTVKGKRFSSASLRRFRSGSAVAALSAGHFPERKRTNKRSSRCLKNRADWFQPDFPPSTRRSTRMNRSRSMMCAKRNASKRSTRPGCA
jgi:hypothetical protein